MTAVPALLWPDADKYIWRRAASALLWHLPDETIPSDHPEALPGLISSRRNKEDAPGQFHWEKNHTGAGQTLFTDKAIWA